MYRGSTIHKIVLVHNQAPPVGGIDYLAAMGMMRHVEVTKLLEGVLVLKVQVESGTTYLVNFLKSRWGEVGPTSRQWGRGKGASDKGPTSRAYPQGDGQVAEVLEGVLVLKMPAESGAGGGSRIYLQGNGGSMTYLVIFFLGDCEGGKKCLLGCKVTTRISTVEVARDHHQRIIVTDPAVTPVPLPLGNFEYVTRAATPSQLSTSQTCDMSSNTLTVNMFTMIRSDVSSNTHAVNSSNMRGLHLMAVNYIHHRLHHLPAPPIKYTLTLFHLWFTTNTVNPQPSTAFTINIVIGLHMSHQGNPFSVLAVLAHGLTHDCNVWSLVVSTFSLSSVHESKDSSACQSHAAAGGCWCPHPV
ncbi:hypothetical protein PISMIDRAFT_25587 [Pisolithus microcarpus 441]|uniref:Uncharacterized protein n=1 Tax=Pisolithus microcarpus 441 TaxID=765257 RepID=A0A0C9Y874_9AGAM|nr:hypothetical protein BKA83DRAFT_25587 [Pisolithus microcarpus]KIK13126.1 hypothetical protein PISMIDRAFT_25587 [Pisolithus microcarpus 441]